MEQEKQHDSGDGGAAEADIERLPTDLLAQSIILWSCRHVTEAGLVALVNKCRRLECINVGGMRVSPESFVGLLSFSPALQIRSIPQILNVSVQVS